MVVWLVRLVGGFKMPLPTDCPMEFASMPEHFVEDAMELLIFASRIPKALDGVVLVGFLLKDIRPQIIPFTLLIVLSSCSFNTFFLCRMIL